MSGDTSVTVEQWISEEIERLSRFRSFWNAGVRETPKDYPVRLPLGEWDEQYRVYADDLDGVAIDD